jgi:two-component system, OmpR family, response regulator
MQSAANSSVCWGFEPMRLLLLEDDPTITAHVKSGLAAAGYLVDCVADGPAGWDRGASEDYSAIILDLGLPGLDGLTILRQWRREGLLTPVIVLTARGSWMERVDGFDAGADDYIPKPFRMEELLARLRALMRRTGNVKSEQQAGGRFVLDRAQRRVLLDGAGLDLTPNEFRALALLIERAGQVISPIELATHVQGRDDDDAKNAVEAMIGRIRRKTFAEAIITRRGFGYELGTAI